MVRAYLETPALRPEDAITAEQGRAFKVDKWTRLDRFLILGSESNTIYASARDILKENVASLAECLAEDPVRTVMRIVAISKQGRATKNEPALFALAKAASHPDVEVRKAALRPADRGGLVVDPLLEVARTGTHLLHFMAYLKAQPPVEQRDPRNKQIDGSPLTEAQLARQTRGTGRMVREAIQRWFLAKSTDDLAYQLVKYQQRDGWSMADLMKMAHVPAGKESPRRALHWWLKEGGIPDEVLSNHQFVADLPRTLLGFENAKRSGSAKEVVEIIQTYRLPREAIPTRFLDDVLVWEALLADMPITAMIRNLAKMTSIGLLDSTHWTNHVSRVLTNEELLKRGRVHPVSVLSAMKVYSSGHGVRGSLTWVPNKRVVTALDEAFYLAFGAVRSTGKRIRLGVDVSGSMVGANVVGLPHLDAATAAAAMALVTRATEPNAELFAYSHRLVDIPIQPHMRLDEVLRILARIEMGGGTYVRLPIEQAWLNGDAFDAFVSYTDSETMDGYDSAHGYYSYRSEVLPPRTRTANEALLKYREKTGIMARHAVVAFSANDISVAHPDDPGQIDFVGLDAGGPALLADFIAGDL